MTPSKTCAVVNPRSASGKTGRRWPELAAALEARIGPLDTLFTGARGHAIDLAHQAAGQGADLVIAVGGDGTINEVANGLLRAQRPHGIGPPLLGVLPMGTGGDFRRSLGLRDVPHAIDVLAQGASREIDVGKVIYRGHAGAAETRYFVNLVSFGMGGEVAARARNFLSSLSGKLAFLYATVGVFFRYRAKQVRLSLDGAGGQQTFTVTNIAVGNGRYHGGGMHICPLADLEDGLLEVTVVDRLGMVELARDLPVLYSGNVYKHPKTRHFRARRVTAEADEPVSIEVDGEPLGTLPLDITILPKALRILWGG